jgi:hypothetical protein
MYLSIFRRYLIMTTVNSSAPQINTLRATAAPKPQVQVSAAPQLQASAPASVSQAAVKPEQKLNVMA